MSFDLKTPYDLGNTTANGYQIDSPWGSQFTLGRDYMLPDEAATTAANGSGQLYQLSSPMANSGSSFDWGSMAAPAVGAASQTAQMIAAAAQAQAARDFQANQGDLDRGTRAKLARMQLAASAEQANRVQQANAYNMLLSAYSNNMQGIGRSTDLKRNANAQMDQLLASAFLRPAKR